VLIACDNERDDAQALLMRTVNAYDHMWQLFAFDCYYISPKHLGFI
jgi:hypothetical protein